LREFISENIGEEIKKICSKILPLQNIFVRKVNVLQRPFDSQETNIICDIIKTVII